LKFEQLKSTGVCQPVSFRLVLALYSLVLAIAAIWLLCAELLSPGISTFPTSKEAAVGAARHRSAALWAARVGGLRGDLWSDAAFTYADLEWANPAIVQAPLHEQATAIAIRAVSFAPVNPAVWLMLADVTLRADRRDPNPAESLKMSYYTGPNEDHLIPLRLATTAQLNLSADSELTLLFQRELENILTNRPELKPAIRSAYQQATSPSRQRIEDAAQRLDSAFAQSLLSGAAR
jgi:hypothetical protein